MEEQSTYSLFLGGGVSFIILALCLYCVSVILLLGSNRVKIFFKETLFQIRKPEVALMKVALKAMPFFGVHTRFCS